MLTVGAAITGGNFTRVHILIIEIFSKTIFQNKIKSSGKRKMFLKDEEDLVLTRTWPTGNSPDAAGGCEMSHPAWRRVGLMPKCKLRTV